MKHFVYLNQRNLYSFYAQAFDGLEKERQTETSDTVETGKTKKPEKTRAKLSAALKTPFLDAQAEIGSEGNYGNR